MQRCHWLARKSPFTLFLLRSLFFFSWSVTPKLRKHSFSSLKASMKNTKLCSMYPIRSAHCCSCFSDNCLQRSSHDSDLQKSMLNRIVLPQITDWKINVFKDHCTIEVLFEWLLFARRNKVQAVINKCIHFEPSRIFQSRSVKRVSLLLKPIDKILTFYRTPPQRPPGLQHIHLTPLNTRIDPWIIVQKLFKQFLFGQQRQFQINHAFARGCEPFVWRHWICWWQWQWAQTNPLTQCLPDRRFCLQNVWQHFFKNSTCWFLRCGVGQKTSTSTGLQLTLDPVCQRACPQFLPFLFFACWQWISRFGFGLCAFGPPP